MIYTKDVKSILHGGKIKVYFLELSNQKKSLETLDYSLDAYIHVKLYVHYKTEVCPCTNLLDY